MIVQLVRIGEFVVERSS